MLNKLKTRTKVFLLGSLVACNLPQPQAFASDYINQIDDIVVIIHDYSVITGQIKSKMTVEQARILNSKLNLKLVEVRNKLVAYDSDLSKNWKYLIETDNTSYPHRQLLKEFDLNAYSWFNFERNLQQISSSCFSKKRGQVNCVIYQHNNAKKQELSKYAKLTDTLDSIQAWRKQFGR